MIIIFGNKEREREGESVRKSNQSSFPYLHPPCCSSCLEVFWRNEGCLFLFLFVLFCIATQWAWPLQPHKEKLSLGWTVLVHVHHLIHCSGGRLVSHRLTPQNDAASCSQGGLFLPITSIACLLDLGDTLQCTWLGHSGHGEIQRVANSLHF